MKLLLYTTLIAFVFAACKQEAPVEEKDPPAKSSHNEAPESNVVSDVEEEEDTRTYDYYAGTIGLYGEDVLVEITRDELKLSGRYWYLKHGRQIFLEGDASAKSGEWQLTESVKKVVTGHMTLQSDGDNLTGQWYAPGRQSDVQEVALKKVYTSENGKFDPEFETYTNSHIITIYNGETDEEEEASDDIRLVRIGDYVLFQCYVIGANAHTGHINGLAKFESKNMAIFQGEGECQLSLTFEGDEVTILEDEDCSYYRGMRAYFGGTLSKTK